MDAVAKLRNCPMSARKMRLGADLIRNKPVSQAVAVLHHSGREAGVWLEELLLSAVANWENRLGNTESAEDFDLYVKAIMVDQGPQIKRFRPAPQGRAHRIRKHSNHVTIVVANRRDLPGSGDDDTTRAEAETNTTTSNTTAEAAQA